MLAPNPDPPCQCSEPAETSHNAAIDPNVKQQAGNPEADERDNSSQSLSGW